MKTLIDVLVSMILFFGTIAGFAAIVGIFWRLVRFFAGVP